MPAAAPGVKVDRASLRCVASQPWLFPRSMMVGFIAQAEAGAEAAPLRVDEAELQDAFRFSEYDEKKKEAKRHELEFKETEKELRQKDLTMQESMIQFSVFLQGNEQKKNQARDKKEKEEATLKIRKQELEEK